MECPNENCDHDFNLDEFGQPSQDVVVECPKCRSKVEAFWDYQLTEDDEYPFIAELWLIKEKTNQ